MQNFYVYTHHRPDDSIFYVGKGKKKRAWSHSNRNLHWENTVSKFNGFLVKFVKLDIDEELAFLLEQEVIDIYKKRGERLVNQTDGGDGVSGLKFEEHSREKISKKSKEMWSNQEFKQKRLEVMNSDEFKILHALKLKEAMSRPEVLSKMRKPRSEQAKINISESAKGRKQSQETIMKRVFKNTGKKRSEETLAKMSISNKAAWVIRKAMKKELESI